jgi:hypothetical protein
MDGTSDGGGDYSVDTTAVHGVEFFTRGTRRNAIVREDVRRASGELTNVLR